METPEPATPNDKPPRPRVEYAPGWTEKIPAELKDRPQWVVWRYEFRDGKFTKVPYQPRTVNGRRPHAKADDSSTWGMFAEALAAYQANADRHDGERLDGPGYEFVRDDEVAGVDFDDCLTADGELLVWADEWLQRLGPTYAEVSPSGRGIKAFYRKSLPAKPDGSTGRRRKGYGLDESGEIETYDQGRYFALTGAQWWADHSTIAEPNPGAFEALVAELDARPGRKGANGNAALNSKAEADAAMEPPPVVDPSRKATPDRLSDVDLLAWARKAKNGAKFSALYDGDCSGYSSGSEADCALLILLAFWTGSDAARMERLFSASDLGKREKWEREDYRVRSIAKAIELNGGKAPSQAKTPTIRGHKGDVGGNNQHATIERRDSRTEAPADPGHPKETQAEALLRLAAHVDLFHTNDGRTFGSVVVGDHCETHELRSSSFKRWLTREFYQEFKKPPSSEAMQGTINVLESYAQFDGKTEPVYVRVAPGPEGSIYIDLANEGWEAAHVKPGGWSIISNPPVRFRRPNGMRSLPTPSGDGSMEDLRRFINVTDDDWPLFVACITAAMQPAGPFPILSLFGEQGTAKSTTAKVYRLLCDPHVTLLGSEPKEMRDLAIAAANEWTLTYDNLSSIPVWLSDGFCRLSTGGGFSTRKLYSDDELSHFDARRPVILTGIGDVVKREDLADRCVFLNLRVIPEDGRLTEREFWGEFDAAHPRLLGALLSAVAAGLEEHPKVKLDKRPRMADFAVWGEAVCRASGMVEGAFLEAYLGNRQAALEATLEDSPVASAVKVMMKDRGPWEGTAKGLGDLLNSYRSDGGADKDRWPKSPRGISGALHRAAPSLRAIGIEVDFVRTKTCRTIKLRRSEVPDSPSGDGSMTVDDGRVTVLFPQPSPDQVNTHRDARRGMYSPYVEPDGSF